MQRYGTPVWNVTRATGYFSKTFNDLHHHCHRDRKVTTCKGGLKEGEETVLWNTGWKDDQSPEKNFLKKKKSWCVVSHILRHQYSQLVTPHLLLRGATINTSSHALSFWITLLRLQVLNMIFCFKYQWQKIRWFWIILVLVYRLSVTEASSNDTGVYTCTGPTVTVWSWWSWLSRQ